MTNDGPSRREDLVETIVNGLGNLTHDQRFTAFGAARMGIVEAAAEMGRVYPQLDKRIQDHFGLSGWNMEGV